MNVIISYLETMFSAYPQTPRLLEAKDELQGMMEDAYTSLIADGRSENEAVGQVIRDFGNLEEVAPVLGIAVDIAPASSVVAAAGEETVASAPVHPPVTMDEARGYAEAQRRTRFRLSTAVMLFVLSPAALISLPSAAESGLVPITPDAGAFIGILMILVLVAIGVMLIITTARETGRYKRIGEGRFSANPEVTRWAQALAEQHERGRIRALQIAIALWILSPIPLIAFALLMGDAPERDFWTVIGVVLVLVIVATGLGILLPKSWAHTVAEELERGTGRGGLMDDDDDEEHSIVGVIAAFYWPLLTAIYLGWSFLGNSWYISWIVWPIGAVLFGAIAAGGNAIESYRRHSTRRS